MCFRVFASFLLLENFGEGFESICEAIKLIAQLPNVKIVYPVHLNPNVQEPVRRILGEINNIYLIDDSVQGKNDAQRFYNGYKTAGNAVVATGYFIPLLIPALSISIATTTNVPKDENLNYPSKSLMQNEKYANSYRQEALKIKKRKVWLNFLITLPGALYVPVMKPETAAGKSKPAKRIGTNIRSSHMIIGSCSKSGT